MPILQINEINIIRQHFQIEKIYYNESDMQYTKKVLRAMKETSNNGIIFPGSEYFIKNKQNQMQLLSQFIIEIVGEYDNIILEVRKRGIFDDRPVVGTGWGEVPYKIMLRVNDVIVVY